MCVCCARFSSLLSKCTFFDVLKSIFITHLMSLPSELCKMHENCFLLSFDANHFSSLRLENGCSMLMDWKFPFRFQLFDIDYVFDEFIVCTVEMRKASLNGRIKRFSYNAISISLPTLETLKMLLCNFSLHSKTRRREKNGRIATHKYENALSMCDRYAATVSIFSSPSLLILVTDSHFFIHLIAHNDEILDECSDVLIFSVRMVFVFSLSCLSVLALLSFAFICDAVDLLQN